MFIEILIAGTRGSAPREAGTRMWVGAGGIVGTIGGGNLEYTAVKIAREMLASGEESRERRFALGDSLGQCCGGAVALRFRRTPAPGRAHAPSFDVLLFGAGHVGKEVARILERVPCRLTWLDPRPEMSASGVTIDEDPADAVNDAPAGAFYLVMTHSHALDLQIVERVLGRGDAAFVGLIGSATKAAKFRLRLARKGIACGELVCPIGLFKAGKHPAEIAVSAVAQLLERRAVVPVGRALESVAGG